MLFYQLILGMIALGGAVATLEKKAEKVVITKYFWEPGRGHLSGHHDARFFKNLVDYETRLDTLQHTVRAWLKMTAREGIETWIAHGTLLGWWWNEKMLPWDWDMDVQMSAETLTMIGKKYNMTEYEYESDDGLVKRKYLLDVNPWIWQRTRGDRQNIIDARWIDMDNGLYIDITGLAAADPQNPGVLNCKNWHRYLPTDIWPLQNVTFEGLPAWIPNKYDKILIKEYTPRALFVQQWNSHRWNIRKKVWEFAFELFDIKEPESEYRIPKEFKNLNPRIHRNRWAAWWKRE